MAYGGIGEYAAAAAGDAHAVQVIANGVGAHALIEVFIENKLNDGRFFRYYLKVFYRRTVLV